MAIKLPPLCYTVLIRSEVNTPLSPRFARHRGFRQERQISINVKDSQKKSKTDWDEQSRIPDEDIDYSDIPLLYDKFFNNAKLRLPKATSLISIRIDRDVLEWFKSQGGGYQNRMNAALGCIYKCKGKKHKMSEGKFSAIEVRHIFQR